MTFAFNETGFLYSCRVDSCKTQVDSLCHLCVPVMRALSLCIYIYIYISINRPTWQMCWRNVWVDRYTYLRKTVEDISLVVWNLQHTRSNYTIFWPSRKQSSFDPQKSCTIFWPSGMLHYHLTLRKVTPYFDPQESYTIFWPSIKLCHILTHAKVPYHISTCCKATP